MYSSHHRADQSLDVAPEVGRCEGTEIKLDVMFAATTAQWLAAEISAIVGSQDVHQAAERPLQMVETARQ
jgi:hypothetical protein